MKHTNGYHPLVPGFVSLRRIDPHIDHFGLRKPGTDRKKSLATLVSSSIPRMRSNTSIDTYDLVSIDQRRMTAYRFREARRLRPRHIEMAMVRALKIRTS